VFSIQYGLFRFGAGKRQLHPNQCRRRSAQFFFFFERNVTLLRLFVGTRAVKVTFFLPALKETLRFTLILARKLILFRFGMRLTRSELLSISIVTPNTLERSAR